MPFPLLLEFPRQGFPFLLLPDRVKRRLLLSLLEILRFARLPDLQVGKKLREPRIILGVASAAALWVLDCDRFNAASRYS